MAKSFNVMTEQLQATLEDERHNREELERAVRDYVAFADEVAEGNLTVTLPTENDNEQLAHLSQNLNQMVESLSGLAAQVRQGAEAIGSSTAQILTAASQHYANADQQATEKGGLEVAGARRGRHGDTLWSRPVSRASLQFTSGSGGPV